MAQKFLSVEQGTCITFTKKKRNIANDIIYKSCGVNQKHYKYASLSMEVA